VVSAPCAVAHAPHNHHPLRMHEATPCPADQPAGMREALAAPLLGPAAGAPRLEPLAPVRGDDAAPRRGGQAELRPVLRRLHEAPEPGALGELRQPRPRGAGQPARAGPGAHALARVEPPQRAHLPGPAARRGMLREGAPLLSDCVAQGRAKSYGGPTARRSGAGGHTAQRGGVV
jgi:hypothetical protein